MKILELKINNFLSLGDVPALNLDNRGLVLIQGVNEDDTSADSNGVGKSSIADALCWVLFGETARGVSGDGVVNNQAKKNCSVGIIISEGAGFYRITRYRKHKEFKNTTRVGFADRADGSEWADLSKGTEKETQVLINQVIGCELEVFMAAIYAGQEVTPDLPKMTDKQLKSVVEQAAGIDRLERCYEIARERHQEAARDEIGVRTSLDTSRDALTSEMAEVKRWEAVVAAWEDERPKRVADLVAAAEGTKKELLALGAKIKAMGEAALTEKQTTLKAELDGFNAVLEKQRSLDEAVQRAAQGVTRANSVFSAAMREVDARKRAVENSATEIKKPCKECGKPHTEEEIHEFVAHQKTLLQQAALEAKNAKAELEAATSAHELAVAPAREHRATIPDTSVISSELAAVSGQLREIVRLKGEFMRVKANYDRCVAGIETAKTELCPDQDKIELFAGRVKAREAAIEEKKALLEAATAKLEIQKAVSEVFGPAGVRARILDTVTPMLNERTADYLSVLSDGNLNAVWSTLSSTAKGEIREKFNIDVTNDKGADNFAGLSGGQKRKVRLATMLALQDLVASRATKPIGIWCGDEIDAALDKSGLERLMTILERKARERGTVLVVSHSDLRDWVDQVCTVTKGAGTPATIGGALCL